MVEAEADAARKRAGIIVPEVAGARLARWSSRTGANHGEEPSFPIESVSPSQYSGGVKSDKRDIPVNMDRPDLTEIF